METSETIIEIAKALVEVQRSLKGAKESGKNPHLRSKYAKLDDIWDACREPLTQNSIAVIQSPDFVPETGIVTVTTQLVHTSGEWIRNILECQTQNNGPQAIGSAITYLRRYSLAALVGITAHDEDDDGEQAQSGNTQNNNQTDEPDKVKFTRGDGAIGLIQPRVAIRNMRAAHKKFVDGEITVEQYRPFFIANYLWLNERYPDDVDKLAPPEEKTEKPDASNTDEPPAKQGTISLEMGD